MHDPFTRESSAQFNKLAGSPELRKRIADALEQIGGRPEVAVQAFVKFLSAGLEWDPAIKAAKVYLAEPMPGGPVRHAAAVRGGGPVSKASDGGEIERVTAQDLQASIETMTEDQKADLAIRLSQQVRRIAQ